jgi:hypothetical protein
LDGALIAVVYIMLALGVYSAMLSSLSPNESSHIHRIENVLSHQECHDIIRSANVEAGLRHGWTTRRHKAYPTTYLSIYSMNTTLSPFVSWLNNTIESRVFPLLSRHFNVPSSSLVMRDLFVVKYDEHGQHSLPEHRDNSKMSFNIALSSHDSDFQGGGTSFSLLNRTIHIRQGSLLCHDSGVYHAGSRVTVGTRYILVGFVNLREIYWWRAFGTYATCMSCPPAVLDDDDDDEEEEITTQAEGERAEGNRRTTLCRSVLWTTTHQLSRTLSNIKAMYSGTDGSTINVDTSMKVIMLVLFALLGIVLCLLAFVCLRGDFSSISSIDIAIMTWFSLLSEEELTYCNDQQRTEQEERIRQQEVLLSRKTKFYHDNTNINTNSSTNTDNSSDVENALAHTIRERSVAATVRKSKGRYDYDRDRDCDCDHDRRDYYCCDRRDCSMTSKHADACKHD